ncbi:MAG TPA: 30S ribosomal protein S8 [Candidatus Binataceae bacterium]|jgi:small subunit ribosomal protein S8|nr:30S ribosomal protein S8 [Candidatus Binataceae bacterium]HZY58233.1 30S ribosomal protein S8 [Candidatus Binataceae bacterium]
MSQTDPIAEMLTRIRNAAHARHAEVEMPHSRLREAVARVLAAEGFLQSVATSGEGYKRKLLLGVRYTEDRQPVMRGLRRVSRPGLRRYAGCSEMPKIRAGLGIHVVSTPLGVMTDREARRKKVGGEVLLAVW